MSGTKISLVLSFPLYKNYQSQEVQVIAGTEQVYFI